MLRALEPSAAIPRASSVCVGSDFDFGLAFIWKVVRYSFAVHQRIWCYKHKMEGRPDHHSGFTGPLPNALST